MHGKKIGSNCSLAYHRLQVNTTPTPTATNPSTHLPVRCKVLDCRKLHCTYAMPHHMAQAHPVCPMTMPGAAKRRTQKCCKPLTISWPHCHRSEAFSAAGPVFRALLFGPNPGSSGGGSSSSSSSTTNASSSTSASCSSSAPSGTSDYVPSESMSNGQAPCEVTRSQAARPKKRARPKSTGKRARDAWEDDSDA